MKKKYIFKTEQEFIEEFGDRWKKIVGWNSRGLMDYLFGTEIRGYDTDYFNDDDEIFELKKSIITHYGSYWNISNDMVKEVNVINYNEKKVLVYD